MKPLVAGLLGLGAYAFGKDYADNKRRAETLQRAFERFHERIRHEQFGERDLLRERREALEARLAQMLPREWRPRLFPQGSYKLQTGVKPLSGEFDLDMGLVLECARSTFSDPIKAKELIQQALRQGSRRVRVRRSCVTVAYSDREYGDFHIDIAIYVVEPDGVHYLAKGKPRSDKELKFWEAAAPEDLTDLLNGKYSEPNIGQFRRCIRYLKRWKHINFDTKAPYSIALTVAAYHWFEPKMDGFLSIVPNDLEAVEALTLAMLRNFSNGRLRIPLPVAPNIDLLHRMEEPQMRKFRERLEQLHDTLANARVSADVDQSLDALQSVLGSDFG